MKSKKHFGEMDYEALMNYLAIFDQLRRLKIPVLTVTSNLTLQMNGGKVLVVFLLDENASNLHIECK